jgi:hypothetical protein
MSATPKAQLDGFLAKFTPEIEKRARAALKIMRARYPTANQMVYDNYNFMVVGFAPSARPSEAIFSLALYARGVGLCFLQNGPKIPDPEKLLQGNGNQVRHVKLQSAEDLERPAVKALMSEAVSLAKVPFPKTGRGTLVIRSISAKQRPRRPVTGKKVR